MCNKYQGSLYVGPHCMDVLCAGICIYISSVCVCVAMCLVCICVYVCLYVRMSVSLCVCVCVSVHVCVCGHGRACAYVCVYLRMRLCVRVCIYKLYTYMCYTYVHGWYYTLQLLAHDAVLRWDQTIYEGIRDMCNLLVELIAVGLQRKPVPIKMLELLTLVS